MTKFRKTLTAGLAAVTLGMSVAAISTPAAAWGNHPHWGWGGHHWGWGVGAAVAGLALGAAAAASATPYYGYPACYLTRQPVVDDYGNIIGYRRVRVCN